MNFQVTKTILNACTKKVWKVIEVATYVIRHDGFCFVHTYLVVLLNFNLLNNSQ